MALGPCCTEVQQRRVELVEGWSQHIVRLLEYLYQIGAITEEDVSLVHGSGCRGDRDRMRELLDVLYGRGEESCRAFLSTIRGTTMEPMGVTDCTSGYSNAHNNLQEALRKHKEILAREHSPMDYFSIHGVPMKDRMTGPFTETTLSQRMGYTVPLRYHHEATEAGDAFRKVEMESGAQGQMCEFSAVCQQLLVGRGDGVMLLSGVAGSGKTTLVRRLTHRWAVDDRLEKVVFSLSFRELNLVSESQSLLELLCVHYSHLRPVLAHLLTSDPTRILLIFDGLDEFRFPLDFDKTPKCSDPELPQPMGAMAVNLIKGNLLPGISILLTSRPHAVSKVPMRLVSVFYSVLGFSPGQQQQYFLQTCQSADDANRVWQYVSSHKPLLLMCHIPAFCWIVATALQDAVPGKDFPVQETASAQDQSRSADVHLENSFELASVPQGPGKPATVTEIYCCFLKAILVFHGEGRHANSGVGHLPEAPRVLRGMRPALRNLGALAFRGLLERRFLFDSADVDALGQSHSEFFRTFLVETLREHRASLACERSYHFFHTSLQEFLAAVYYVLQTVSGNDPFSELKPGQGMLSYKFLKGMMYRVLGPERLMRKRIKMAFHLSERQQSGHLDLFCRFVSGLLVPSTQYILNGLFSQNSRRLYSRHAYSDASAPPFLLKLLHSQLQCGQLRPERQVNACYCLYEALDPGLLHRWQRWLRLLSQQESPRPEHLEQDWSELAFLLELSPALRELNLEGQGLGAEGLRRLLPVLPFFSTVRLGQNPLGPEGAAVLSLALKSPDCRIERLWVVDTGLGCEGMKMLADGLRENSTVVDLRMAINCIGDEGAGYLAELLQTNRTLRDIRLRDNQVTDKGGEVLMEALTKNTILEYLWMFDNKFSKDGVKRLKDFAKSRPSLDIKVCV